MAKIKKTEIYPLVKPTIGDMVIGTRVVDGGRTVNFSVSDLISTASSVEPNMIISISDIEILQGSLKVKNSIDNVSLWRINNVNYTDVQERIFSIPPTQDGYYRIDLLVVTDNTNEPFRYILGIERQEEYFEPQIPLNSLRVLPIHIHNDEVSVTESVDYGDYFIEKKSEKWKDVNIKDNSFVLDISTNYRKLNIIDSISDSKIVGFKEDDGISVYNNVENIWNGLEVTIKNGTSQSISISNAYKTSTPKKVLDGIIITNPTRPIVIKPKKNIDFNISKSNSIRNVVRTNKTLDTYNLKIDSGLSNNNRIQTDTNSDDVVSTDTHNSSEYVNIFFPTPNKDYVLRPNEILVFVKKNNSYWFVSTNMSNSSGVVKTTDASISLSTGFPLLNLNSDNSNQNDYNRAVVDIFTSIQTNMPKPKYKGANLELNTDVLFGEVGSRLVVELNSTYTKNNAGEIINSYIYRDDTQIHNGLSYTDIIHKFPNKNIVYKSKVDYGDGIVLKDILGIDILEGRIVSGSIFSNNKIVKGIYPVFYGIFTGKSIDDIRLVNLSKKVIDSENNVTVNFGNVRNKDLVVLIPSSSPLKTKWFISNFSNGDIGVNNTFNMAGTRSFNSPEGFWSNISYNIYKTTLVTSIQSHENLELRNL